MEQGLVMQAAQADIDDVRQQARADVREYRTAKLLYHTHAMFQGDDYFCFDALPEHTRRHWRELVRMAVTTMEDRR